MGQYPAPRVPPRVVGTFCGSGRFGMKLEALDHPKTLELVSRLGVGRAATIGHLELLWAFTSRVAIQGNIGKWPDGAIAESCYWTGEVSLFIDSLVAVGYLDRDPEHRLVVHDWHDHCPNWVRAKLTKRGLEAFGSTPTNAASEGGSGGSGAMPEGPKSTDARSNTATNTSTNTRSDTASSRARVLPSVAKSSVGKRGEESEGAARLSRAARSTATRLPEDFSLTPERRIVAEAETLPADRTFAKFCDYWRAASGAKARKHDWDATWRNWCRSERDRGSGASAPAEPVRTWRPEPGDDETAEVRRARF